VSVEYCSAKGHPPGTQFVTWNGSTVELRSLSSNTARSGQRVIDVVIRKSTAVRHDGSPTEGVTYPILENGKHFFSVQDWGLKELAQLTECPY
jgi:hypothetical protein